MTRQNKLENGAGKYRSNVHFGQIDHDNPAFTAQLTNGGGIDIYDLLPALREHKDPLQSLFSQNPNKRRRFSSRLSGSPESGSMPSAEFSAEKVPYGDGSNWNLSVLTGKNGKRAYVHGDEVYIPDDHQFHFRTLAGYLFSRENELVPAKGPVADIAFYGTIASNNDPTAPDWMGINEDRIHKLAREKGIKVKVSNPNTKTNVQHDDKLDMSQFAREALNLFGAEVVVMNFEPRKGGIALAELRMAMLASVLTGHKLIVRMEDPDMTNINFVRSRAVALADIEFFRDKFGDRLNMGKEDILEGDEPFEKLADKALDALQERRAQKGKIKPNRKFPVSPRNIEKKVVLSGSSASFEHVATRMELAKRMEESGTPIDVDTYIDNYDGDPTASMRVRMEAMKQNRLDELQQMMDATNNIVFAGNSLSKFGQMTTALLFAAYNGSDVHVLFSNDSRNEYDTITNRAETARVVMNPLIAFLIGFGRAKNEDGDDQAAEHTDLALLSILSLSKQLVGVAPWMGRRIRVMTDGLRPAVDSFKPFWRRRNPFSSL